MQCRLVFNLYSVAKTVLTRKSRRGVACNDGRNECRVDGAV